MLRNAFWLIASSSTATVSSMALGDKSKAIPTWTRQAGDYEMGNDVPRKDEGLLQTPASSAIIFRALDAQYGQQMRYRGFILNQTLVEKMPSSADAALLHFENGIQIIVERKDIEKGVRDRAYQLFLAIEVEDESKSKGLQKFSSEFPAISRKDERFRDPRPITFTWNKLVVGKKWIGSKGKNAEKGFSPWKHVSSLSGIEWIDVTAYRNQFSVKGADSKGLQVYLQRCSSCHGVKKIGSTYGWDFVDPLPIYEKRSVGSLFSHVKYPKGNPIQMGMHMPHQPDFTESEAEHLWGWLRSVSKHRLRKYTP
jgi:hypothetical protein